MGWRERIGADDERARIAARARALLDAAGGRPQQDTAADPSPTDAGSHGAAPASPFPSPRGGWVPPFEPAAEHASGPAPQSTRPPAPARPGLTDLPDLPGLPDLAARPDLPAVGRAVDPPTRPTWRDRVRFEPGRRGLVAVAAVVVVVGSVAGGVLVRGGRSSAVTLAAASGSVPPSAAPAAPVVGASGSPSTPPVTSPSAPATASPAGTVTVDVAGLVARPGVYTLPAGSRVDDALRAAGGARAGADLSTLNRARVLVDGEQLAVGVPGAPAGPVASGPDASGGVTSGGGPSGLVDLNTADLAALDTLPGVGPVTAQKILDWRTEHGRFASVDDLQQVSGIGPARFADLKDLVTV